jgi:hypothetical protein
MKSAFAAQERRLTLSISESDIMLTGVDERLESFGLKLSPGGAHISRTMMLEEASLLLSALPPIATADDYRRATIEENVARKATRSTREKTFRHLRELYGLSTQIPLFAIYRELMNFDPSSAPLLSFQVSWSRDTLLRGSTPAVMNALPGSEVSGERIQQALQQAFPNMYSQLNIGKIARNAASSWTQAGHLSGRTKKIRQRVQPRSAALTLGLILAYVQGLRGQDLFGSIWCRLLDLTPSEASSLASQAHREDLLTMRAVGSIVEISFPRFRHSLEAVQ